MPSELFKKVKQGLPDSIQVLEGNAGDALIITVDVNEMQFPYSVNFDGSTIMHGVVDRSETIPNLQPGVYDLGWGFSHSAKNWKHVVTAQIGDQAAKVLDSRSEENKDRPFTLGTAVIVVN